MDIYVGAFRSIQSISPIRWALHRALLLGVECCDSRHVDNVDGLHNLDCLQLSIPNRRQRFTWTFRDARRSITQGKGVQYPPFDHHKRCSSHFSSSLTHTCGYVQRDAALKHTIRYPNAMSLAKMPCRSFCLPSLVPLPCRDDIQIRTIPSAKTPVVHAR